MNNQTNLAVTPGEILPESIQTLLNYLPLSSSDIFYDLGSGTGNVVLYVFMHSKVGQAHGIELVPEYHQLAKKQEMKARLQFPEVFSQDRVLTFHEASFFDISFQEATVIFLNSLCFTQQILKKISRLIDQSHSIHTIFTTRPLLYLKNYRFVKTFLIQCSWDSALCYVYKLI